jgi:hypothetical protein
VSKLLIHKEGKQSRNLGTSVSLIGSGRKRQKTCFGDGVLRAFITVAQVERGRRMKSEAQP